MPLIITTARLLSWVSIIIIWISLIYVNLCVARRQRERQAIMVQLQEKLKQRLVAADEAEARDQKEQEVLKQEQMATMARVLSTNMELDEE